MVLVQPGEESAGALHIGMEVLAPFARRVDGIDDELGIAGEIPGDIGAGRLADALAIRAIVECGGRAAGDGDRERPVLTVIGEGLGLAIDRVRFRVAIGIVADALAIDGEGACGRTAVVPWVG